MTKQRTKLYAGIGSRNTPQPILNLMQKLALKLSQSGYTLRSGGAKGADTAFAHGAMLDSNNLDNREIFLSGNAKPWAFEYVAKHCMPNDRGDFKSFKPYIQGLLARNMMQILGEHGQTPVEFVVCWAPSLNYEDSSAGGTSYAIRCAQYNNIPVYNLYAMEDALSRRIADLGT